MANQGIIDKPLTMAKVNDNEVAADFPYSGENVPNGMINNLEFTDKIDIDEIKIEPILEEHNPSNQEKYMPNLPNLTEQKIKVLCSYTMFFKVK